MRSLALLKIVCGLTSLTAAATEKTTEKALVEWTLAQVPDATDSAQNTRLELQAHIATGYHLYALRTREQEPAATAVTLRSAQPLANARIFERAADKRVFSDHADFPLLLGYHDPIQAHRVDLMLEYSVCSDRACFPPREESLSVQITAPAKAPPGTAGVLADADFHEGPAALEVVNTEVVAPAAPLSSFLWIAFALGLASVLTPCVFPMLPITVSYFLQNGSSSRRESFRQAVLFGGGIVAFFCGIGILVTLARGPFGTLELAGSPVVSLAIALVLTGLAFSLFGVFEWSLPSRWLNRLPRGQGRSGLLLMGLSLTLTSFACIGPFMGTLLATSIGGADFLRPALGMAVYSLGLTLPFALLALFPTFLRKLPRSGPWMRPLKAGFGVLVLIASAKYWQATPALWSAPAAQGDLVAAKTEALRVGKSRLVIFSGESCTNCHWMKENILGNPRVATALGNYVSVEVFTDGRSDAARKHQALEQRCFGTVALPFYAILDEHDVIQGTFSGLTRDENEFLGFLNGDASSPKGTIHENDNPTHNLRPDTGATRRTCS